MGSFYKNGQLYTGRVESELKNRNVEEIITHNAIAITDVGSHYSGIIDVSHLSGEKYLHIDNGLDVPVDVTIYVYSVNGSSGYLTQLKTISANSLGILDKNDVSLLSSPIQKININIYTNTAPSTGQTSVFIEGVEA